MTNYIATNLPSNISTTETGTVIQQPQTPQQSEQPIRRRQTSLERTLETLKLPLDPSTSAYGDGYDDAYYADGDEYYDEDEYEEYDEEDESRFVNLALLSHLAVSLKDKVPRGTRVKDGIPYGRAFMGKDVVVSTLH